MSTIRWTTEQKRAIETEVPEVLVAAAAGSGKTSVLTGRCLHYLGAAERPCDITDLLVLTFTEAAADEMRRRIRREILRRRRQRPQDPHWRRQALLVDRARISTIHAFCRGVLAEYFYRLPLDANFEVLDADEADLIKVQIGREVLDQSYARCAAGGGEPFVRFLRAYAGLEDRGLVHLLIRLHNFLDTLSDRAQWSDRWQSIQQAAGELPLVRRQRQILLAGLDRVIERLDYARGLTEVLTELAFYRPYLEGEILPRLGRLRLQLAGGDPAGGLDRLRAAAKWKSAPRRPAGLADGDIAPVRDLIKNAREEFKDLCRDWTVPPELLCRQIRAAAPAVDVLIDLQRRFDQRYQQVKRGLNVLDFADLEHLCLQLLRPPDRSDQVAFQVRRRYRAVLIDEYQDISPLQEAILDCLRSAGSSPSADRPGGPTASELFMVGDVKQSIYGFRQADPGIFLAKFHLAQPLADPAADRRNPAALARVDLNENFRSRREIIEAVNYLFGRLMTRGWTGMDYRREGQLRYGARFYDGDGRDTGGGDTAVARETAMTETADSESAGLAEGRPADRLAGRFPAVEIHLLERSPSSCKAEPPDPADTDTADSADTADTADTPDGDSGDELDDAYPMDQDAERRQAALVAGRIRRLLGLDAGPEVPGLPGPGGRLEILDPQTHRRRPVRFRDIVVLLRSVRFRAQIWCEQFRRCQVPVHAELSGGFFVATEIQDMINLLKLIDNPLQDIPLAAVLRSRLVGLDETELAEIRQYSERSTYAEAVFGYARSGPNRRLKAVLADFLDLLDGWRTSARRQPLGLLLWEIYRRTDYLAYVCGLADGRQRYRNLLQLHDRARQFDSFAHQGLDRFLRFIERLREQEGDFGPAPVLTEADDVVRIMSIHKSKGLEFPVVIVGNLSRRFNQADLQPDILFDRDPQAGVGVRLAEDFGGDRYATLLHQMVRREKQQRALPEELRILYVALTRARERLILTADVSLAESRNRWRMARNQPGGAVPDFVLQSARCPLDWLGWALGAHPDFQGVFGQSSPTTGRIAGDTEAGSARFAVQVYDAERLREVLAAIDRAAGRTAAQAEGSLCSDVHPPAGQVDPQARRVIERLTWTYPHRVLTGLPARTSVTEIKRRFVADEDRPAGLTAWRVSTLGAAPFAAGPAEAAAFDRRPDFLDGSTGRPDPTRRGTWTHQFMQFVDLDRPLDGPGLQRQWQEMVDRGIFGPAQLEHVDLEAIGRFFAGPHGRDLLANRGRLRREWPFTLALPAGQVYPEADLPGPDRDERLLVRGIIDCLYRTESGWVVIDFKTDRVAPAACRDRGEIYRPQMLLYRRAVEVILDEPVCRLLVYFLAAGQAVPLGEP